MDNVRETLTEIRNLPPNVAQKRTSDRPGTPGASFPQTTPEPPRQNRHVLLKKISGAKINLWNSEAELMALARWPTASFFAQDLTAGHACYTYRYPFIVISNFAVNPRFQGQGVGRKIIEELIKKPIRPIFPKLLSPSSLNQPFTPGLSLTSLASRPRLSTRKCTNFI